MYFSSTLVFLPTGIITSDNNHSKRQDSTVYQYLNLPSNQDTGFTIFYTYNTCTIPNINYQQVVKTITMTDPYKK